MPEPLPREEVAKAVERRGPSRVPMMIHKWTNPSVFDDRQAEVEGILAEYPNDAFMVSPRRPPDYDDPTAEGYLPGYSWLPYPPPEATGASHGLDAATGIGDWSQLDEILAAFPDASRPEALGWTREDVEREAAGRYTVFHWWYGLFEQTWAVRGMQNLLMDFHLHPEPLGRWMDALTDFWETWIRRAGTELGCDAVWFTDDLGTQTGPMFSPEIFRAFFKPRYRRLADAAHACGMSLWLHACGNMTAFMDDLVEIGFDVVHPVQKYAMDMEATARRFGDRLTFWAGMDMQQILPHGTPEDVRAEVRFLIDTFDRPDGGCMITAGNGVTPDVPVENLRAFFDETYTYGIEHRRRFAST